MDNADVAQALHDIALLLEIKGENPFKIRSYENAAQVIEKTSETVAELVREKRLRDIEGIGEALEQKITELVTTGELEYLNRLRNEYPETILDLLKVEGLGPKSVKALHENLGIGTLDALREACEQGKLREVSGFSEKREQKILDAIAFLDKQSGRFRLNTAWKAAAALRSHLLENSPAEHVEVAGSLRRYKETVKDIDIIAAADDPVIPVDDVAGVAGSELLRLSIQRWGGHCGFIESLTGRSWYEGVIIGIIEETLGKIKPSAGNL